MVRYQCNWVMQLQTKNHCQVIHSNWPEEISSCPQRCVFYQWVDHYWLFAAVWQWLKWSCKWGQRVTGTELSNWSAGKQCLSLQSNTWCTFEWKIPGTNKTNPEPKRLPANLQSYSKNHQPPRPPKTQPTRKKN